MIELSVITPTFERRDSLLRLLDALDGQTMPADRFEVIVVDDGSKDDTVSTVQARAAAYRLVIREQAHRGPAAARNNALAHVRGRIVVFLDDDVVPAPELLSAHEAAHRVAAGAVVVGPMHAPRGWPRPAWIRWEEDKLYRQYDAMRTGVYPCTPRQFYTGNASVELVDVLGAGGFDESLQRAEDVELGYRLQARGARFIFEPEARVLHYAARSLRSWRRARYMYGRTDVVMDREKGHRVLEEHLGEFHIRHLLSRLLARSVVGRPLLVRPVIALLSVAAATASGLRIWRVAGLALSATANILYWQGACDEVGGRRALWRLVAANHPLNRSSTAGERAVPRTIP